MRRRLLGLLGLGAIALLSGPALGAEPDGIVISDLSGADRVMTSQEIGALPAVQVTVAVEPGHGPPQRTYEGPLLWAVLERAGVVHADKFREQVRQMVTVAGSDGYTVLLALGEISPEFEGKQVIVAERADGQPLASGHLRLIVPGEKRAGRSVRDLVRIGIAGPR